MTDLLTTGRFNRRRFLANSAVAAGSIAGAGALLDACSTANTSTGGSGGSKTTLTIMYNSGELTPAYIKAFEKTHPNITIKYIEYDATRLSAMLAAGSPPDFIRTQGAPVMPNLIARGVVADLTSYFDKSSILKTSDLQPICDVYRWDGKNQGVGPRYGMVKDWSQDVMMWYNKKIFDDAKVPYPSETTPLTYDELLDLSKRLTVRTGGKIQTYGLDAEWGWIVQGHLNQMIGQQGGSLYNADFSKVDFTTPEARKAIKWFIDWAQAHVGPSPLDPDPSGWSGPIFNADRLGIAMYGYWFGGNVASATNAVPDHVGFLPAPVMGSTRISACMAGTGAWIPATSKNKDAAWAFMEYFMGQGPAMDRAKSGWGLPALTSLFGDMPQTKPYQQEAFQVQQAELPYLKVLNFSPYISDDAFSAAFTKVGERMIRNQVTFDQGIQQLNDSINQLLAQGKEQVS